MGEFLEVLGEVFGSFFDGSFGLDGPIGHGHI